MRWLFPLLLACPALAEEVAVPSGQAVTFVDMIPDTAGAMGLTYRFRFLAPGIAAGGGVPFEVAAADMAHLCVSYALPRISETGPQPEQIVIALMDRPVEFGQSDPDAVQFFEAYRPDNGACIWEAF